MSAPRQEERTVPRPLALAAALVLAAAGTARAQAPADASSANPAALQRLASDDPQVRRARWGSLADAAGKAWLQAVPGDLATVWRDVRWVVPGASLRYHRGFCIALQCQGTDYLVQYNEAARQLEFHDQGALAYVGRVQDDGSVRLTGTGLLGVLTAETLSFDAAAQTLSADRHVMHAATPAQLASATRGFAGGTAERAAAPASAASAAGSEAELRAELAAMKARVDALSRQVEQQQVAAVPASAAAPALTASQAREAERRAQREARSRAAEEQKQAAEARAREEAARKAEALARAKEEAQARAAEAQRLAAEKRSQQEEARRAAAEAKEREAQARAAEVQRLAEEKRSREDAVRRAAAEAKAAQAAPRAAAATAAATNVCGGIDGVYGIVSSNYRIEVKFSGDTLTVVEPNRTSPYRHVGQCQYLFTHPNGTEYKLGVVPRGLVAYKDGQSEAQKTQLALLQPAAAPQAEGKCRAEQIPVQNPGALHPGMTRLFGTRSIQGVTLEGTYKAPEPDGRPMTVLAAGGRGTFEVYGAPKPQYVYRIENWYIQVNCDGSAIEEDFPAARRYWLVYKLDRPYSGLEWHREQFIVRKGDDKVSIDDRSKARN